MDLDLTGKIALVTGSTAGIGFAIAEGLVRQKAHVWINGRTQPSVYAAIAKIGGRQGSARLSGIADDLSTAEGVRSVTDAVPEVDILVNNYGGAERAAPFLELSDGDWHQVFEANVAAKRRSAC
jgi:NAD(P)-dependent dehydrogenase (short-subunit alcohol dehydrogenase family)